MQISPFFPEVGLLAGLVQALADSGAGVVGLTQHTRTLEEIFLTLTAPKEVG